MLGWFGKSRRDAREQAAEAAAEQQAQAAALAGIQNAIKQRFEGRVFFVPEEFLTTKDAIALANDLNLQEGKWDLWARILERFPNQPRTHAEVTANEIKFWRRLADKFTVQSHDGKLGLVPHADIKSWYKQGEKWILREYFAATGQVIEPFARKIVRMVLEFDEVNKQKMPEKKLNGKTSSIYTEAVRDKAGEKGALNSKNSALIYYEMPEHYEKWGNWLVSHIEDAFNQAHSSKKPSPNYYGEGGFASLRDVQAAQGRPDVPQHGAQSQIFKD